MTAKAIKARTAGGKEHAHDGGPRLDPDVTALMTLSANLQRATARELRDLWRKKKLSERGLYILELVNAGLDRPSRLIEYFNVLPSTITFETDKLVTAGLMVREVLPSDRRVVRLRLTDRGRAVHRETTMALNALLRPRIDQLTREELQTLLALFRRIVEPLTPPPPRAEAEPEAPPKRRRGG